MMKHKMPFLYKYGRLFLTPLFRFYYNPTVIGKENIPESGSVVIAGNHNHLYDQFLTVISTKRFVTYMAKREYFDSKKTRWFFKGTGCISVDRSIHDDAAKEKGIEILKSGDALGIFPEGTRNKTDAFLLPFKYGAVSMAKKTDAYILPFGITGDYKFRSKNLTIRYGKPFKVGNMNLVDANEKLYKEVEKLMKESIE